MATHGKMQTNCIHLIQTFVFGWKCVSWKHYQCQFHRSEKDKSSLLPTKVITNHSNMNAHDTDMYKLTGQVDVFSYLSYNLKRSLAVCSIASGTTWTGNFCKTLWKSCSRLCFKLSWEIFPKSPTVQRAERKSRIKTICTEKQTWITITRDVGHFDHWWMMKIVHHVFLFSCFT